MALSTHSISIGLYILHTVLGGSVKFEGPEGTKGDIATCTSDNNDDYTLANFMENENLGFRRVNNDFVTLDTSFSCAPDSIKAACEDPEIGGVVTCGPGEM
jgi:hypothetical protein